jgi:putative alpha-1,2-mannosidase
VNINFSRLLYACRLFKAAILTSAFLGVGSPEARGQSDYASFVNSFIGTGGHGHTYPGPNQPFGMVQLSPDTRLKGWDGSSGYHYSNAPDGPVGNEDRGQMSLCLPRYHQPQGTRGAFRP